MKKDTAKYFIAPGAVFIFSFIVYCLTACRTITWWGCPSYVLAANELGILPAPGSLLLTLIGWVVSKIPFVHPLAFRLNLLAGLFASLTGALAAWLVIKLQGVRGYGKYTVIGSAVGGLSLAFSIAIWTYAVQLSPYILTTVFTGLILWTLLQWWEKAEEPGAWRWLLTCFLLYGLDFSVHRTNGLLLLGALIWIGLRDLKKYRSPRTWACIIGGLAAGLSFHLLLIPLAIRGPFLNIGDPGTLRRFWYYISLQQHGGGFLFDIFPRKASFFKFQIIQYINIFASNFAVPSRLVVTLFPLIMGIFGCVMHFRYKWKQALSLLVLFLIASLGSVIYHNIPEHYIRTVDRHFMPSLVIFTLWIGYGVVSLLSFVARLKASFSKVIIAAFCTILALIPFGLAWHNWPKADLSHSFFAEDYGHNILAGLPRNAILFTNGDNDTFPLWYLQKIEGFRTDVDVLNLYLLGTGWYLSQIPKSHPSVPLDWAPREINDLSVRQIHDTVLALPIAAKNHPGAEEVKFVFADSSGNIVWAVNSQVVWRIISRNSWQRPVCFAVSDDLSDLRWVIPHLRFEGMHYQVMPVKDPAMDIAVVRKNMMDLGQYRGVNDRTILLSPESKLAAGNYAVGLLMLAQGQWQKGDKTGCQDTKRFIETHVPLERIGMGEYQSLLDSLKL